MNKVLVRSYTPGFIEEVPVVIEEAPIEAITEVSFLQKWKELRNFSHFEIQPTSEGELIILAKFTDLSHWVAGFAAEIDSQSAESWRQRFPWAGKYRGGLYDR